jgi:hypothetical protein
MGYSDTKLSKYLTQTFMSHGNEMICQTVTLSGYAERPKVADTVIEAGRRWWPWAREGLSEAHVFAGDEPCTGEEIYRAFARFYALQTARN